MLAALSHDFVHRRNIRIASNHPEKTPFVTSTAGSHHTNLTDAVARLYNWLRAANAQCTLLALPELQLADSGETFGLVPSEHISTFGGLVKEEVNEFQVNFAFPQVDSCGNTTSNDTVTKRAIVSSRDFIFHELNIDPKLLELPQVTARSQGTMDAVLTSTKRKVEETPQESGMDAVIEPEPHARTLEQYFKHSSYPHPPKSRKGTATDPTQAAAALSSSQPDSLIPATQSAPIPAAPHTPFTPSQPLLFPANTPSPMITWTLLGKDTSADWGSTVGHKTRSQQLFLAATGIHPDSLMIKGADEFFLFMDMCAEFQWVSYEMTSRKWVDAMEQYNHQLVEKCGTAAIRKNPLALFRKLGEMEARLIERVQKNDFKCKSC